MSPSKTPVELRATPVDAFLRTVGAELRAASEFLGRPLPSSPVSRPPQPATATSPWRRQPPLLLPQQQPRAAPPSRPAAPPPALPANVSDAIESHSTIIGDSGIGSSIGSGSSGKDGGVDELLGALLQESDGPQAPARAAGAADAAPAPAAADATEEQPEDPEAETHVSQAGEASPADDHAAAAGAPAAQAAQLAPALRGSDSHAKVLSWLSSGGTDGTCETLVDAVPARPAAAAAAPPAAAPALPAARRPAAQLLGASGGIPAWRPDSPAKPASLPLRPAQAAQAAIPTAQQACYGRRAAPAWQHHTLAFARPACPACGLAEADCGCTAAAEPLRLLRPRHLGAPSPTRRGQQQRFGSCGAAAGIGGMPAPGGGQQRQLAPAGVPVVPQAQLQPGAISINSIHTAFIGGSEQQQPAAAGAWATPVPAAPAHASVMQYGHRSAPPTAAPPQLDMWAAYLASRQPADATALALPMPAGGGAGGALAQLQTISQRIRSMQGSISSFLLQQRSCPPAAGVGDMSSRQAHSRVPAQAAQAPAVAARAPPAAQASHHASQHRQAAATAQQQQQADLFTDDFVLAMQTGMDWRSLAQAAPASAAPGGSSGSGTNGSGASGGGAGSTGRQSAAVQRLKEVQQQQREVTAVRVGRLVAVGRRSSSMV